MKLKTLSIPHHVRQQAREISHGRRNHYRPCRWNWLDWAQDHQGRPNKRPQRQCHELRQVHGRHGGQHRPEEVSRGPEDTAHEYVSKRASPVTLTHDSET